MIAELAVRDLGVFADTRLVLDEGLTALTGETGAGKSLVVGAIQLLLGARADAAVVRPGAEEAIVDGRFVTADGEEVVLSRVVPAHGTSGGGRSRAYVNGRPVTVAELAERGATLVELHGQHAHQQLLQAASQREALDRFAGVDLAPLREARARIVDLESQLAELGGDDRTRAREIDLLRYQLDELDGAGLTDPDEDERLDEEEDLLADAVAHREAAAIAAEALVGDEGVAHQLQTVIGQVGGRGPFAELEARLRSAAAEITEAAHDLRDTAEAIADDPERLVAVRERRQLLAELRRKYGDTLAEVIEEREAVRRRLDELVGHDARAEALEVELGEARTAERSAARAVAKARRAAAPVLAGGVQERLRTLAMPNARVEVVVEGDGPADDVRFLLAANPGGAPQPVAKVASGGELSRATLALRLELTAGPPSLVFDEVDAGIGGEAAWAVASSLATLSGRHQILVVTHLPQVAAFADRQIQVAKVADDTSTTASARALEEDARVEELARMLSGQPDSEAGRQHAVELLEAAAAARRSA
ncbi:MAG TPA: DNA repair protein RecN [Acidimicrobiales bacterium]|nr:DNA repair protein RecN [Acidimicrobiales bacterium]